MPKKPLLPVLSLALLALAAPQSLPAQEEYEPESSSASMSLDTMVVTATRMLESKREVTANTTVVTAEQIRNSTAKSLDEVLVQQGFQVTNLGARKLLKIRGMGAGSMGNELESNVLVLLNGRRIGSDNVAVMGLDNIDRLEIIRGPSAVQFGSSAMGGVVNVITKRGVPGQTEAAVELGFGSYDLYKGLVSLSGGAGAFDFSGSVTNWGRGDYDVPGGHRWKHTGLDSSTSLNLDLGYTFLENQRLGLNFNLYDQNEAEFPSAGWSETGRPADPSYGDYLSYDYRNHNLALSYEGASDDERFSWLARYSFGKDENKSISYSAMYGDSYDRNELKNDALAAQVAYSGDVFSVAAGLDYIKYDYRTLELDSSQKNTAGYLSAKLRLLDERLILTAGGRYDHFKNEVAGRGSISDNNFAPSVGLAVLPNDWLKFRANYSEGFKMASPRQMVGFKGAWANYIANPDLEPEKSETFEVGMDLAWNFLEAGLTYFHTDWDDKILGLRVAGGDYQYQNVKAATIKGLELALSANIGQALGWEVDLRPYLNLTYLMTRDNKDRNIKSKILPDTPKYSLSYGLDIAALDYDFKANLNAVYSGEVVTTKGYDPFWNPIYAKHSGGTVVNMSLEKGLYSFDDCSKLSLKVDVNNLFDADNDAYYDYPGPGRNFYVGLRYEFK